MRYFNSYGPVDAEQHFCVPRYKLVDQCIGHLIGHPEKGGNYFTIWAARQTGKTWLMQQAMHEIPQRYGDTFAIHSFSLGAMDDFEYNDIRFNQDTGGAILPAALSSILEHKLPGNPQIHMWEDFIALFRRNGGLWDRPVILLIDEVDSAAPLLLDMLVRRFREMYIDRSYTWLHGLALTGVRAVVGLDSLRGSPFNVQRSLHVPNFTVDEVRDLYQQYQDESGQAIDPAVVDKVYDVTRGQPGLVSWFGELLTETYNPTPPYQLLQESKHGEVLRPIGLDTWQRVWLKARFAEPNNTILNLIAKARMHENQEFLIELFRKADVPFSFHDPLHNHLYMHGVISSETIKKPNGELQEICRFTSPFIQDCIYQALGKELVTDTQTVLALQPLDRLEDVFQAPTLNLPALLTRYKDYLARLKTKGINPWKSQPRRDTDAQLTEAVGHFHLYAWLQQAIGNYCAVSPEFPTGNGKVDIHIRCEEKQGVIEVKSFVDALRLQRDKPKAADYARHVGLNEVTMAVFIPVLDEDVLAQLSGTDNDNGVQVNVVMIGWF